MKDNQKFKVMLMLFVIGLLLFKHSSKANDDDGCNVCETNYQFCDQECLLEDSYDECQEGCAKVNKECKEEINC